MKDAVQALTRHDFEMAVMFNRKYNKDWFIHNDITDTSLMADLLRLLQGIQPVLTPPTLVALSEKQGELTLSETASSPCVISAVPPVPPVPEQYIQAAESCYQQAPYNM